MACMCIYGFEAVVVTMPTIRPLRHLHPVTMSPSPWAVSSQVSSLVFDLRLLWERPWQCAELLSRAVALWAPQHFGTVQHIEQIRGPPVGIFFGSVTSINTLAVQFGESSFQLPRSEEQV